LGYIADVFQVSGICGGGDEIQGFPFDFAQGRLSLRLKMTKQNLISGFVSATYITVDGTELISRRSVFSLLGDRFEIRGMVLRTHSNLALPEQFEGRMAIEDGSVFGVHVEDVRRSGATDERSFDAAKKRFEDRVFERVKEEDQGWRRRQGKIERIVLDDLDLCDCRSGGIGGVFATP
jgi:hypothetical protein